MQRVHPSQLRIADCLYRFVNSNFGLSGLFMVVEEAKSLLFYRGLHLEDEVLSNLDFKLAFMLIAY